MFEHLTGCKATKQHAARAEFNDRMTALLLLDDEEMVADLKADMQGDPLASIFDEFWDKTAEVLEEAAVLVAEQNRGDNISRTAIDISYASLRRTVVDKLEEGTPIPSRKWFEYQFFPHNPETNNALKHTGRFAVKMKTQQRSMRKQSTDAPYGLQSWRMFKDMAVLLGDYSIMVCQDDKKKYKLVSRVIQYVTPVQPVGHHHS
jgi:hypothetical protein